MWCPAAAPLNQVGSCVFSLSPVSITSTVQRCTQAEATRTGEGRAQLGLRCLGPRACSPLPGPAPSSEPRAVCMAPSSAGVPTAQRPSRLPHLTASHPGSQLQGPCLPATLCLSSLGCCPRSLGRPPTGEALGSAEGNGPPLRTACSQMPRAAATEVCLLWRGPWRPASGWLVSWEKVKKENDAKCHTVF